jgi:hypothetical protein
MSNVVSIFGGHQDTEEEAPSAEPNEALIEALENALAMARTGQLRFVAAVGAVEGGHPYRFVVGAIDNPLLLVGAAAMLKNAVTAVTEKAVAAG